MDHITVMIVKHAHYEFRDSWVAMLANALNELLLSDSVIELRLHIHIKTTAYHKGLYNT